MQLLLDRARTTVGLRPFRDGDLPRAEDSGQGWRGQAGNQGGDDQRVGFQQQSAETGLPSGMPTDSWPSSDISDSRHGRR